MELSTKFMLPSVYSEINNKKIVFGCFENLFYHSLLLRECSFLRSLFFSYGDVIPFSLDRQVKTGRKLWIPLKALLDVCECQLRSTMKYGMFSPSNNLLSQ